MATPADTMATDGLSTRMATTVKVFLPVANALSARGKIGSDDIDLANGENNLMKLEMVDMCKKAMSDSITANVRQNQNRQRKKCSLMSISGICQSCRLRW